MKTRMTELFGIKYPIMLAGMNWLTTPKLVAAVSNAGGLGVLAGNHQTPDGLREAIQEIRSLTDKPFGVNLTLGVGSAQRAPIVIEEKVPVLNYALGRPPEIAPLIEAVHGYGGKVIGTIALLRHAALVVSNDTGPGHIAAALGRPIVMVFGRTNPARVAPYRRNDSVAAIDPFTRGKIVNSTNPMHNIRLITLNDVYRKALAQIKPNIEKPAEPG